MYRTLLLKCPCQISTKCPPPILAIKSCVGLIALELTPTINYWFKGQIDRDNAESAGSQYDKVSDDIPACTAEDDDSETEDQQEEEEGGESEGKSDVNEMGDPFSDLDDSDCEQQLMLPCFKFCIDFHVQKKDFCNALKNYLSDQSIVYTATGQQGAN